MAIEYDPSKTWLPNGMVPMTTAARRRPKTCLRLAAAWPAAGLAAVLIVSAALYQFRCVEESVDVHSGRMRTTKRWLSFELQTQTSDTWLSRSISKPIGSPRWRTVDTFCAGERHSPHSQFHAALAQVKQLELLEELVPFEDAARARIADQVLGDWRSGSYFSASESIEKLAQVVTTLHDRGAKQLTLGDLP